MRSYHPQLVLDYPVPAGKIPLGEPLSAEDDLRSYFRTIWRDTPGVVYLPSRGENPKDWVQSLFSWPKDEDRIVQMVQARTGSREVFVNPVLYKDNGVRDKTTILRSNVLGTWTLWVDFDGNAPSEWSDSSIPVPTMRVQTSTPTHQHCYWSLEHLLDDPTEIENRNRTLAYQLNADTSGWDVSQLLRPVGTTNHKFGKDDPKSYEVFFEELSKRTYPASIVATESIVRPVVDSALAQAEIPSITEVLAFGKWSAPFLNCSRLNCLLRIGLERFTPVLCMQQKQASPMNKSSLS